jgi:hypothetical protein
LLIKPDFEIETDGGRAPTAVQDMVTSHDIESGINNYILKVSLGIIGDIDDLPIGNYTIIFQISQIQEADQYEYIPFTLCIQEASIISCSSSTFPNEASNTTIPVNYSFFLGILLLNRIKKRSS